MQSGNNKAAFLIKLPLETRTITFVFSLVEDNYVLQEVLENEQTFRPDQLNLYELALFNMALNEFTRANFVIKNNNLTISAATAQVHFEIKKVTNPLENNSHTGITAQEGLHAQTQPNPGRIPNPSQSVLMQHANNFYIDKIINIKPIAGNETYTFTLSDDAQRYEYRHSDSENISALLELNGIVSQEFEYETGHEASDFFRLDDTSNCIYISVINYLFLLTLEPSLEFFINSQDETIYVNKDIYRNQATSFDNQIKEEVLSSAEQILEKCIKVKFDSHLKFNTLDGYSLIFTFNKTNHRYELITTMPVTVQHLNELFAIHSNTNQNFFQENYNEDVYTKTLWRVIYFDTNDYEKLNDSTGKKAFKADKLSLPVYIERPTFKQFIQLPSSIVIETASSTAYRFTLYENEGIYSYQMFDASDYRNIKSTLSRFEKSPHGLNILNSIYVNEIQKKQIIININDYLLMLLRVNNIEKVVKPTNDSSFIAVDIKAILARESKFFPDISHKDLKQFLSELSSDPESKFIKQIRVYEDIQLGSQAKNSINFKFNKKNHTYICTENSISSDECNKKIGSFIGYSNIFRDDENDLTFSLDSYIEYFDKLKIFATPTSKIIGYAPRPTRPASSPVQTGGHSNLFGSSPPSAQSHKRGYLPDADTVTQGLSQKKKS